MPEWTLKARIWANIGGTAVFFCEELGFVGSRDGTTDWLETGDVGTPSNTDIGGIYLRRRPECAFL